MQKLINVLAVLSFLGTASIIGGGAYVYVQKDAILEDVKEKATEAVMEAVTGALPGLVGGMMPELPGVTGGEIPSVGGVGGGLPSTTGPALPF